ncbi:MAG: arginase, partial [Gammaproteobacteria bacterium]|nr:arginase [Gammaproteobacteria bacterium]
MILSAARAGEDGAFEPVDLPPELAKRLEGLPGEKMEFLRGEGALNFAERHDILFARFRNKSAAEIEGYIDAMMRVRELLKFDPERDLESIPLNTEAEDFNWFRTRRPPEFDTPREPGPINVSRYLNSGPKQGIPTFFNLPIALTPADLKAGDVEVAIMGAGLDTGSGFRGAAYGPRAVRTGVVYK